MGSDSSVEKAAMGWLTDRIWRVYSGREEVIGGCLYASTPIRLFFDVTGV